MPLPPRSLRYLYHIFFILARERILMYNEAQKNATMKYLSSLKEIRFRVKPEEYERYQEAAAAAGYSSMRQFFMDAIQEKVDRIFPGSQDSQ